MNDKPQIQLYKSPVFPPSDTAPQLPQVINVGGKLYHVTPVGQNLPLSRPMPWGWLALSASAGILTGGIALMFSNGQQLAAMPEPVVIEKPIAIPTTVKPHCIMFCGD